MAFQQPTGTTLSHVGSTSLSTTVAGMFVAGSTSSTNRAGIYVHCPAANGANLYITAVPRGASAPGSIAAGTNLMVEVLPGGTFEGDGKWGYQMDIYVQAASGTISYDAWELN